MDGSQVSISYRAGENSALLVQGAAALQTDVFSLYQRVLPPAFLEEVLNREGIRQNNRIYNPRVVLWLMMDQRLQGNASMQQAVLDLGRGLPSDFWPRPCKRLREGKISGRDASYSAARQELPLTVVEQSCDRMLEELAALTTGSVLEWGRRAFFFDGTSVRMPHSEELVDLYPPGSNQHGESHWPLLRMLVAHDLETGLALRPQWGPLNGPHAVSEQQLLERALHQLPPAAVIVGDSNFGVFSVAYAAQQRGHPVVLRLTTARAKSLAGALNDGVDREIEWRPSRDDRRSHPELPAQACVRGRLIISLVKPDRKDPFLLVLFTTLPDSKEEILKLYGKRWNIELDLRTLKSTLRLEQLTCTTSDMVAKEIDVAMAAYNLVRAVTYMASQQSGLAPRRYSFTRVRNVLNAFLPLIASAKSPEEAQRIFAKMMYYVGQAKLPNRKKRSSYPRAVWPKPHKYPKRKA